LTTVPFFDPASDRHQALPSARRIAWLLDISPSSQLQIRPSESAGGLVAQYYGWRAAFLVAGLPGLLFAFFLSRMADPRRGAMDGPYDAQVIASWRDRLKAMFANRTYLACTASYAAYLFAMGVLTTWGPTLASRKFGVGPGQAGTVFGAIAIVTGIGGTFAGGFAADALQKRHPNAGLDLSATTLLLAAPLFYLGLRAGDAYAMYALFGAAMVLLFANTSPVSAQTVSCLPAPVRATGMAVNVLFTHLLGDAISSKWVGMRSDSLRALGDSAGGSLENAMTIAAPAIIVSGAFLMFARKAAMRLDAAPRSIEA
jgi:MFS family permease